MAACSKVLSFTLIDDATEVTARLALGSSARVIKIERLRLGGDEPFAIETCYLSAADFSGLTRASMERGSLFSILKHDYDIQLSYADEEIDGTAADPGAAQLLGIPKGFPLLRIRQLIYSTKAKATVYVQGLYRSDRHSFLIRRFR
jgi:GntR family transcriptional regulator